MLFSLFAVFLCTHVISYHSLLFNLFSTQHNPNPYSFLSLQCRYLNEHIYKKLSVCCPHFFKKAKDVDGADPFSIEVMHCHLLKRAVCVCGMCIGNTVSVSGDPVLRLYSHSQCFLYTHMPHTHSTALFYTTTFSLRP